MQSANPQSSNIKQYVKSGEIKPPCLNCCGILLKMQLREISHLEKQNRVSSRTHGQFHEEWPLSKAFLPLIKKSMLSNVINIYINIVSNKASYKYIITGNQRKRKRKTKKPS